LIDSFVIFLLVNLHQGGKEYIKMGSSSSQPPAELSEEDIEFISSKAKIDHDSVKVWYEKLKVCFHLILNSFNPH
jgi:hypothetical protein